MRSGAVAGSRLVPQTGSRTVAMLHLRAKVWSRAKVPASPAPREVGDALQEAGEGEHVEAAEGLRRVARAGEGEGVAEVRVDGAGDQAHARRPPRRYGFGDPRRAAVAR